MISRFLLLKEMMAAKLRVELMDTVRAAWILGIMIIRLGVMLLFISQIFRHTNTLMGYTKVEVILVFLIFQWMSTFLKSLFPNRKWMENWMKNGGVNETLGRPVHPLVSVIFSQMNILGLLYFFFISVVLAIYTLCHPGLFKGIFLVSLLAGSSLAFSLQWFMYSVIVVTRKWAGAIDGFYSVLSLMIFPMDIYPFFIRALLIYVIPVAPRVYLREFFLCPPSFFRLPCKARG